MSISNTVSLLRPSGTLSATSQGRATLSEIDLGLSEIVRALDLDRRGRHNRFISDLLAELNPSAQVIEYRQAVLQDLLAAPQLAAALTELLPALADLPVRGQSQRWHAGPPLEVISGRLAELDAYLSCVEGLWSALNDQALDLQSAGLVSLKAMLEMLRQAELYRKLSQEIPLLRATLGKAGSVTVGLNLDAQLRPQSATIVSINPERFGTKGTLLDRLLGDKSNREVLRGLTPLYKASESENAARLPEHELFRELNSLLLKIAEPVAKALERFKQVNSAPLAGLSAELSFYLGAVKLTRELQAAGLKLCRPEVAPLEEGVCRIEGNYNLELALRLRKETAGPPLAERIVTNRLEIGPQNRLFVLTGPNSGGKTTYLRAIGQAQVLFQAGLMIPGEKARLSPVDAVFTHFAVSERSASQGGRLEEELERLAAIFKQANPVSLILLNEPLASTDYASARILGRDVLTGLKLLGARAIYVTHLHELTEDVAGVVSLVAGVSFEANQGAPTYTIGPGRPVELGYATELARRYGLNLSQIKSALQNRGFD